MSTAQRLNELAVANEQGLLNDDEYRLLRQNVFEQYSVNAIVPVEAPIVPIARVQVRPPTSPSPNQRPSLSKACVYQPSPSTPVRTKATVTSGVANLLRRATGRLTSTDPATAKDRDARKANGLAHETPKRSLIIPRLLLRKPPPLRTVVHGDSESPSHSPGSNISRTNSCHSPYNSTPISETFPVSPASLFHPEKPLSTIRDVFDDDNLFSAKDIRIALATTEDEGRRLIDAFNALEISTLRRIRKQNARRVSKSSPTKINVLLEGKEWREDRLTPSLSYPLFDIKQQHLLGSAEGSSDGMSIRSNSSKKTTLSQSKSVSSLRKQAPPPSPLSPHFRSSIARKTSFSSNSSQGTSFGMLSAGNYPSLSRSSSHLALRRLQESSAMDSTDTVGLASAEDGEEESELFEIRKRRDDVIDRYTARLEFLRAKLKGAELHDKLLRK